MMWFLAILGLIAVLLLLPVYLYIFFDGEFKLAVRLLFIKFTIPITQPKSKPKPKTNKTSKSSKIKTDGGHFADKLSRLSSIITSIRERVLKAFVIKKLDVSITVATQDPCATALLYGAVNSILYPLINFTEKYVSIKKKDINVIADYDKESTEVFFSVVIKTFLLKLFVSLILLIADGTIKPKEKGEQ